MLLHQKLTGGDDTSSAAKPADALSSSLWAAATEENDPAPHHNAGTLPEPRSINREDIIASIPLEAITKSARRTREKRHVALYYPKRFAFYHPQRSRKRFFPSPAIFG